MSEIKPGEALGKIARYIVDLEADRDRASDACASVQKERDELREMLEEAAGVIRALRAYAMTLTDDELGSCGRKGIERAVAFLARYEAGK